MSIKFKTNYAKLINYFTKKNVYDLVQLSEIESKIKENK